MKKVLLLAALSTALALVSGAPAMAQSASASPPAGEGNPCFGESEECYAEFGIDPPASASPSADPCPDPDFPRETPDGCQASDLPDVEFGGDPTASPTASPSASAAAEPVSCEQFVALASGEFSQYQAQQFFDFVASEEQRAVLDPDGNGFACDDGEIEFGGDDGSTASASASASASALPETGGPAPAFVLAPLVLLVGTGLVVLGVAHRG